MEYLKIFHMALYLFSALFCCCCLYSWLKPIHSFKPALVKILNKVFPSVTMLWWVFGCRNVNVWMWCTSECHMSGDGCHPAQVVSVCQRAGPFFFLTSISSSELTASPRGVGAAALSLEKLLLLLSLMS